MVLVAVAVKLLEESPLHGKAFADQAHVVDHPAVAVAVLGVELQAAQTSGTGGGDVEAVGLQSHDAAVERADLGAFPVQSIAESLPLVLPFLGE